MMDQAIEAMTKHLVRPLPPLINVPQNKTQTYYNSSIKGGKMIPRPGDDISEMDMESEANRSTSLH
jgi:hypothetical protein